MTACEMRDPVEREHVPFTNIRNLRKKLDDCLTLVDKANSRDQFIVFTKVPNSNVEMCRDWEVARLSYHHEAKVLIAKIAGFEEHQHFISTFADTIKSQLQLFDVELPHRCNHRAVQCGSWTQEADDLWEVGRFTAVIEAGLVEAAGSLELSIRKWLAPENSSVQTVFALDWNRDEPHININLWERSSDSPTSTVSLTREEDTTQISGTLKLRFERFSGRAPTPEEKLKGWIVISQWSLIQFAESFWRIQGFVD
ncbi:hypothetical protein FE257_010985 [Aspergillus nanangensis]|uniref:Uncharacterized protein n=1 Tax=Aspergillus nanangensis TaxID=2582783 RepID=A0AAD4CJQ5_ASPNN|nr:hypothetical protein FE257_010985 [Aspergillus nanangensis]